MGYVYNSINGTRTSQRHVFWRLDTVLALIVAIILSSVTTGVLLSSSYSPLMLQRCHSTSTGLLGVDNRTDLTCGSNADEARQMGCTFDPLSVAWLRPECSRHGLAEFLESAGNGTYHYWRDENGTVEFSDYDALSVLPHGQMYWTTQREHLHHCAWLLLRVHNALETGSRLDGLARRYMHSKHCAIAMLDMAMLGGKWLDEITVGGDIGFGVC